MSARPTSRVVAFLALAASLFCWTGCVTDQANTSAGGKVLRVGVAANSPPIIYKSGGQYQGVEATFARKLAQRLGVQPVFVDMPFKQLLPALDAGKIDIVMSGMTVTAMRTPLAEFCSPWGTSGQTLLCRPKDVWTFSYPEVIFYLKTRIGVEKGSIASALVKHRNPKAQVETYNSADDAANALRANRVDVVVADAPVLWRIAAQHPGSVVAIRRFLTREQLAWAVRRGDTELLNAANAAIQQWNADGTLASVINSYVPMAQQ